MTLGYESSKWKLVDSFKGRAHQVLGIESSDTIPRSPEIMFHVYSGLFIIVWMVQLDWAFSWWIKRLGSIDWTPTHDVNGPEINGRPGGSQHPWASWKNNYILEGMSWGWEKLEFIQQIFFKHYMPATVSSFRDSTAKETKSLFSWASILVQKTHNNQPNKYTHGHTHAECEAMLNADME